MPKKFSGTNTKAAEARARKSAQKGDENERKAAAAEDALWQDDDKQANRKLQRKEDKEKKRIQQLEKKKELQQLQDEEMTTFKTVKPPPQPKITRADIAASVEKQTAKVEKKPKARYNNDDDDLPPLEENLNRVVIEGEARTVDEAIGILGESPEDVDMHPEKRMKAAFKKFEESRLPALKRENPNLRLAQVKQMLQKEWMKSTENPLVQKAMR